MKIIIIGAGPVGLEAALAAAELGHEPLILEAGAVGDAVRRWQHVRLFTPWVMNTTEAGRKKLGFPELSDATHCPTGAELVSRYLEPLAAMFDVRPDHRVIGVSRKTLRKGDLLGQTARTQQPFSVLCDSPSGEQRFEADAVFDCSGTFDSPMPAGPGGLPALGERAAAEAGLVRYGPAPVADLAGQAVLLVGDGASATSVLRELLALNPIPTVHWLTPTATVPGFVSPDADTLPDRRALFQLGQAAPTHAGVSHHPGEWLEALAPTKDGLIATLSSGEHLSVAHVIAATGFRPDHRLSSELQVHLCWGSEGPMKLAGALLAAQGDGPADCLAGGPTGPDLLRSPEPRFFVLGSRSYGRRNDFLMQNGHRQVREALSLLA